MHVCITIYSSAFLWSSSLFEYLSTSSNITTEGVLFIASVIILRTSLTNSPFGLFFLIIYFFLFSAFTNELANEVFPSPASPYNNRFLGILTPSFSYFSLLLIQSTNLSNSILICSYPIILSKIFISLPPKWSIILKASLTDTTNFLGFDSTIFKNSKIFKYISVLLKPIFNSFIISFNDIGSCP